MMAPRPELIRALGDLGSGGRGPVLVTVAGGGFLTVGAQMIYPVLLPQLRSAYALDLTAGGLLLTVVFLTNSLFQFPSGLLSDAIGERRLMAGSSVLCAASVAAVVLGGSTVTLYVATGLFGVGISGFTLGRMSLLPKVFPDRVGSVVGLTFGAADAGQAVLPAAAGLIAVSLAWEAGFAVTLPVFVGLALASWHWLPPPEVEPTTLGDAIGEVALRATIREFRRREIVAGTAIIFLFAALWMSFSGLFPEYLVQEKGLVAGRAALLFGGLFAMGMVVKPAAGGLFDRFGARVTVGGLASISGVGVVALWAADGFWSVVIATALVAPFLGTGTIGISLILNALPDEVTGTGLGLLRTATFSVAALGPALVGALADRGHFSTAFLGLVVIPAVMLFVAAIAAPGAARQRADPSTEQQ